MSDSFLPPMVAVLAADIGEFKAKMGEAAGEAETLRAKGSSSFSRLAAFGKAAFLGLGAAAVGVGVESVKMASSFQSSMELIRTQAGASQAEVDRMSKAVLGLAGQTATAPEDLAAGLYHLESAGLRGARALEALKIAAEGAKVGHADLEEVTNALNATLASGIKGAQNMSQAMGALNATVGAGDMRMQDLAQAMGTGVLATVKGFGLSLNDVSAALATFGDNNIRGADAATQLRMAVLFMAKPARGADEALKKISLTSKQLRDDLASGGLNKALTDLHDHMEKTGYTGAKAGQILLDAFGHKAGTGLSILVGQFARFQSKVEEVRRGAGTFGDSWTATTHTFAFQMQQMKATVEQLAIRVGTWLIPKVREMASAVADAVQWLQKHKAVAEALGVAIATVLTAAISAYIVKQAVAATKTVAGFVKMIASGAAWVASMVTGSATVATAEEGVAATSEATGEATTAAFGPIGLAIAALGVIAFEFYQHWHQIWGFVRTAALDAWHFLDNDVIHPIAAGFTSLWHGIEQVGRDIFGFLRTWGPVALAILVPFIGIPLLIWQHFDQIKDFLAKAWDAGVGAVERGVDAAVKYVTSLPGRVMQGLQVLGSDLIGFGADIVHWIVQGIESVAGEIGSALHDVLSHIPGAGLLHKIHIPGFAVGTSDAPGGLAMVGEHGPELMFVPKHAQIFPHGTTPATPALHPLTSTGGGGDVNINITFAGTILGEDRDRLADQMALSIKNALLKYRRTSGLSLGFT